MILPKSSAPLPKAENESTPLPTPLPEADMPKPAPAPLPEKEPELPFREPSFLPETAAETPAEPEQTALPLPEDTPWRMVGELYRTYILVEQGEEAYLIDKHAAHERILFEKLKANQEAISGQLLLAPVNVRLGPTAAGELLASRDMLADLGFEIEEYGDNTVLLRQIPMDLSPEDAAETLEALSDALLSGRREKPDTVRDELLHTVACKAAIKAGWKNDEKELLAVAAKVMAREDLKYCPHGRPICVSLSKKSLEKQFKRT